MKPIYLLVEHRLVAGPEIIEFKKQIIDVTPWIDAGCTNSEEVEQIILEKNCTEGFDIHNGNFFEDEAAAENFGKQFN
jgi:hypothetical protein